MELMGGMIWMFRKESWGRGGWMKRKGADA